MLYMAVIKILNVYLTDAVRLARAEFWGKIGEMFFFIRFSVMASQISSLSNPCHLIVPLVQVFPLSPSALSPDLASYARSYKEATKEIP